MWRPTFTSKLNVKIGRLIDWEIDEDHTIANINIYKHIYEFM